MHIARRGENKNYLISYGATTSLSSPIYLFQPAPPLPQCWWCWYLSNGSGGGEGERGGERRYLRLQKVWDSPKFSFLLFEWFLSYTGTLDTSLRPGGGVRGCLGSKLWWGGTGIRTPDLLLESQECNHYATGAAPFFVL